MESRNKRRNFFAQQPGAILLNTDVCMLWEIGTPQTFNSRGTEVGGFLSGCTPSFTGGSGCAPERVWSTVGNRQFTSNTRARNVVQTFSGSQESFLSILAQAWAIMQANGNSQKDSSGLFQSDSLFNKCTFRGNTTSCPTTPSTAPPVFSPPQAPSSTSGFGTTVGTSGFATTVGITGFGVTSGFGTTGFGTSGVTSGFGTTVGTSGFGGVTSGFGTTGSFSGFGTSGFGTTVGTSGFGTGSFSGFGGLTFFATEGDNVTETPDETTNKETNETPQDFPVNHNINDNDSVVEGESAHHVDKNSLNAGMIAGIVVGCIAAVVCAVVLVLVVRRPTGNRGPIERF